MNLFTLFFPQSPSLPQQLGANIDTRSYDAKAQDYHISETIASAAYVDWREIPPDMVRRFPEQNQNQKSDCVAETRRKLYRIIFKVNRGLDLDFSSLDLYRRRSNYPAPGMGSDDVIRLCREEGMTLDALVPSDAVKTEEGANAYKVTPENVDIAKVFTIPNEVTFTPGDLETPAGTIQTTRKGVMAWYYFTQEEWSREVPIMMENLSLYSARALRHSVTAVEPTTYNGKKGWWIEDSAHFAGLSRRFITEEFHKARNFWLSYPITFKFETQSANNLHYDGTTVSLQNCLKAEGVFPVNIASTGLYGSITTQAVKDFQKKYSLEQVGTVGPQTKAKLNALYP